jgi:hypothetical protein
MKINDLFENNNSCVISEKRNADPIKLAQKLGKKYGTEKNYGYDTSKTIPGQYIPLKNYNDDLVDDMEYMKNQLYKRFGWEPGIKNIAEIRKQLADIAESNQYVEIKKLVATQPFVRIEDEDLLKQKIETNKTISVTRFQNRYFVVDGHHAVLAANLRGERLINANVLDLDLLVKQYLNAPQYTVQEQAILEGGHTLEDQQPKSKLFDFGKY